MGSNAWNINLQIFLQFRQVPEIFTAARASQSQVLAASHSTALPAVSSGGQTGWFCWFWFSVWRERTGKRGSPYHPAPRATCALVASVPFFPLHTLIVLNFCLLWETIRFWKLWLFCFHSQAFFLAGKNKMVRSSILFSLVKQLEQVISTLGVACCLFLGLRMFPWPELLKVREMNTCFRICFSNLFFFSTSGKQA